MNIDIERLRKELIDYLGEPMVVGNRYNSIFGLSRKNYQKKLDELNRGIREFYKAIKTEDISWA